MLDGLRREFPEVGAYARRIPNPRVAHATPLWAVLAAFGAGFFVSAVVTVLWSLFFRSTTQQTPLPTPFELARVASTAASLAVAFVAGGRSAVGGYIGIVVIERVLGLPSQLRFCGVYGSDPNSAPAGVCTIGGYVIALWPQVLGGALAFAFVRWLRAGAGDRNPTLESAGAFVIVQSLGGALLNASLGPATAGSPEWPLLLLIVAIAAGVAMGYVILRRTTRRWLTLGIVTFVLLGELGILSLPTFVSQIALARSVNILGPFDLLAYFSSLFAIAAAALVLYLAAARRVTAIEGS